VSAAGDQIAPYGGEPPRQRHSSTSCDAADSVVAVEGTIKDRVLAFITERGPFGATDQEIQDGLGLTVSTQVPRRRQLQLEGLIGDSALVRENRSGRMAVVWIRHQFDRVGFDPVKSTKEKLRDALERVAQLEADLEDARREIAVLKKDGPQTSFRF